MAFQGTPFAGTVVTIGTDAVGLINSLTDTTDVTETEVSGVENTVTGDNEILFQTFLPTAVGHTFALAGVALGNDSGQDAIKAAADVGDEVTIAYVDQNGDIGATATGFFTQYVQQGSLPGAWTFTANFRC